MEVAWNGAKDRERQQQEQRLPNLGNVRQAVKDTLEFMRQHGQEMTIRELAVKRGINLHVAENHVYSLKRRGLVAWTGHCADSDRGGKSARFYRVTK